jgi:hypothetical protein
MSKSKSKINNRIAHDYQMKASVDFVPRIRRSYLLLL